MAENSLFSTTQQSSNEALLQTLLTQGVGQEIKDDVSEGKKNIFEKLMPKTRGVKKIIKGLENGTDKLIVKNADDAVDILEVISDIINNKFIIQPLSNVEPNVEPMEII